VEELARGEGGGGEKLVKITILESGTNIYFLFDAYCLAREIPKGVIILYSGSTLNAYSLLSQKLWVPLIKFMMGSTTFVRRRSKHLMYYFPR
jgi:hypothetical protein